MNVEAASTSMGDPVVKRPFVNDDLMVVPQQETLPDTPTSRSSNENLYFNFNRSDPNNYFDRNFQDYLTGLNNSEPPPSSNTNLWQEMATSITNTQYSREVMDTFDFLIKSLSSASNYISALTRDQAGLLTAIRPKVLYEFMMEVAKIRVDRRMRRSNSECAFCRNNGENEECYSSHILKDSRGRVICPVLRAFRCPRCGATGDRAHTIKYCPEGSTSGTERTSVSSTTAQRRVPPSVSMLLNDASSSAASVGQPSPTPTSPHNNFSPFAQTNIWSNFRPN